MNQSVRSPSTPLRLLFFLLSVSGAYVLLLTGFPPGAPDRLPVLVISLTLALITAQQRPRGVVAFAFLFPCAGLLVRLFGATDPSTWPMLLFAGFVSGWTFRFLYDFESVPEPSPLDRWIGALLAVWTASTALAVARARTLWAFLHGLSGRVVNGQGLLDAEAIRESVFSFAAVASGAVFYFVLRRSGGQVRERALRAAMWGVAVSAGASILQRLHVLPAEARGFWRITGRLSGGAVDPNSLGLLCGLALVLATTLALRKGAWGLELFVGVLLVAGLLLSGSRSGLLIVLISLGLLVIARGLPARTRWTGVAALTAALAVVALLVARSGPGTLGRRIADSFDPRVPLELRVSGRPLLWQAAATLFAQHPIEGGGMGSFSWTLPDLLREENRSIAMRDNPGSSYVQALAETGVPGFLLTLAFAVALGWQALERIRSVELDPLAAGAAVALLAFLLASVFGSHWFAGDASLFFFLLVSVVAPGGRSAGPAWLEAFRWSAVLIAAAAAIVGIVATGSPAATFRYSPRIGFHEPEQGPDGPFRWTTKSFALWLAPGDFERWRLTHRPPISQPVDLVARVDGVVLRRTLAPGDSVTLRLNGAPDRSRIFRFSLSRAFVPSRLRAGPDRRELGLRAHLEP
ncbi:MAG TPA: O-antigen ligase family protein [Thermoanaerobaculia bacterium]|nr:O-antigen ligase family protein [Thermoanaerobaculia bacterium]